MNTNSASSNDAPGNNAQTGAEDAPGQSSEAATVSTVRYPVYLNTNTRKSYNILKFSTPVDFSQWKEVTASRDVSMKQMMESQTSRADEMPEFGAGSEYGRKAREEAWRRRRGFNTGRKISFKDLPIKFKVSQSKQYVGKKEGGVDQHSSYFIMSLNPPPPGSAEGSVGSFQLLPVNAWFGATTAVNYKTLDDEEAEEEFNRRDKILNHFNLMLQKRLKDEQNEDNESTEAAAISKLNPSEMSLNAMREASLSAAGSSFFKDFGGDKGSGSKVYYKNMLNSATSTLKISDYDDDFMSSSDEDDEDNEGEEGGAGGKKKGKGKKGGVDEGDEKPMVVGGKKRKNEDEAGNGNKEDGDEVEEESDDGDEEGLELDYNEAESSPSEDEPGEDEAETAADDNKAVPVELDKVIEDQEFMDDHEENDNEEDNDDTSKAGDSQTNRNPSGKDAGKRKKGAVSSPNGSSDDEDSDSVSDGDDPDQMTSVLFLGNSKKDSGVKSEDASTSAERAGSLTEKQLKTAAVLSTAKLDTPATSSGKRKATDGGSKSSSKKPKTDSTKTSSGGDPMEDLIKKYIKRKPISTGELLQKVRKLRPDLAKEVLATMMVDTMSRLGVTSKQSNGKTLWYMDS